MKNKINITYVVNDMKMGGVAKVVFDICSGLDPQHYNTTILSLSKDLTYLSSYKLPEYVKVITCEYIHDENYSLRSYIGLVLNKKAYIERTKHIIQILIHLNPKILHFHTHMKEMTIGILAQNRIKCQLVHTEHLYRKILTDSPLKNILLKQAIRSLYRKYHLIAVSKNIEKIFSEQRLVGKKKKCMTIENTVDIQDFAPTAKNKKDFISVIYVARIAPVKGHADLINSWKKIKTKKKCKLYLVGPDDLKGKIQTMATEEIKKGSVEFLGARSDIQMLLNEADIAVFPSHQEGMPLSLLEKMSMSLPVLVSDIKELTNIIEHNVNGLVYKCGDSDDLAEKLTTLIENDELKERLGKNARATVVNKYNNTRSMIEKHEKFYLDIVDS